jgi:hypothetical protein
MTGCAAAAPRRGCSGRTSRTPVRVGGCGPWTTSSSPTTVGVRSRRGGRAGGGSAVAPARSAVRPPRT